MQELSPHDEEGEKSSLGSGRFSHSLSSIKDHNLTPPPAPLPPRRSGSNMTRTISRDSSPDVCSLDEETDRAEGETEL